MDPYSAYVEMFQAMQRGDRESALERATALKEWFRRGGFYPSQVSRKELSHYLMTVLIRTEPVFADFVQVIQVGDVVITPSALEAIGKSELRAALKRHIAGDWGDSTAADCAANELALKDGLRIFSVYTASTGKKFWVITEADRSSTCVLLPEDY